MATLMPQVHNNVHLLYSYYLVIQYENKLYKKGRNYHKGKQKAKINTAGKERQNKHE